MIVLNPVGRDRRYTVTLEYTGRETPQYVARFCGEWIGSSASYSSAAMLAIGAHQVRMGSPVIEAQDAGQ